MSRQLIGVAEFEDLRYGTGAQIVVSRFSEDKTTGLFLDLDVNGMGVRGAGDCEIGLDGENTRRLLTLLQQAASIPVREPTHWLPVGEAEFSWSDYTGEETGLDSGVVLIESNGTAIRMTLQTRTFNWLPFVATFSSSLVDDLSAILNRAAHGH